MMRKGYTVVYWAAESIPMHASEVLGSLSFFIVFGFMI